MDVRRYQAEALIDLAQALDRATYHSQAQSVWQEADWIFFSVNRVSPISQAEAQRTFAKALAQAGHWRQAKEVAASIQDDAYRAWTLQSIAKALAKASHWQEAEQVARSITDSSRQALALRSLVKALIKSHQWGETERIARSIRDVAHQAVAFSHIAAALTRGGDESQAQSIRKIAEQAASSIDGTMSQAEVLWNLTTVLAQSRQWAEAERIATSIKDSSYRAMALHRVAVTLTKAHLWREAERVATSIANSAGHPWVFAWQAWALRELATALASTQQWQEAERVAASLRDTAPQSLPSYTETIALESQVLAFHQIALALTRNRAKSQAQRLWQQAEKVGYSSATPATQAQVLYALTVAFAKNQQWKRARSVALAIADGHWQARAFCHLAMAMTKADCRSQAQSTWQEAETLVVSLDGKASVRDWGCYVLVAALAEVQSWQEAERVAASIESASIRGLALQRFTLSLIKAHQWQEAERIATSISDSSSHARALHSVASAFAKTRQWQEAERIIRLISLS